MEHITIGEFERKLRNVFVCVADDQEPISVVMDEGREVTLLLTWSSDHPRKTK